MLKTLKLAALRLFSKANCQSGKSGKSGTVTSQRFFGDWGPGISGNDKELST